MELESRARQVIHDHVRSAFDGAMDDALGAARAAAPHRSGRYAASLRRSATQDGPTGPTAAIGSPLPQALAIEMGADVGPRRGPHMGPAGTLAATVKRTFGPRFAARSRSR